MVKYDVIIIGSGAGGSAAAYHLTQTGMRVLLIEKGRALPVDGSTLDVDRVLRHGAFLNDEPWWDRDGRMVVPEEHFNLGGKTRWYGAALLRFAPGEFEPDATRAFLGWPIGYADLEPYYAEAERLLALRTFPVEPGLQRLIAGLRSRDARWASQPLSLGLSGDILHDRHEAAHFDGFASVKGLKHDAQNRFIDAVRRQPNLQIVLGSGVSALLPSTDDARRVVGVECDDGSRHYGDCVLLAAGALHSPRLLQSYMEASGLAARLPAYASVGRNYKFHVLTAVLALGRRSVPDLLSKTQLLTHQAFAHSSVQTLGGRLAETLVQTQAPRWMPGALSRPIARRAIGLFLQTEDGSHADNRVLAAGGWPTRPQIDYDLARIPLARDEHRALVRLLCSQLLRLGYAPLVKSIPLSGTAHACGTLVTGTDPRASVVDANGRVHGMDNLFVVDGSVLPRSSRVNPALTIYAWGLRVASRISRSLRNVTPDSSLAHALDRAGALAHANPSRMPS